MAVVLSSYGTSSVATLIRDLDCDNTIEHNITGAGAADVQQIYINNSANAGSDFYLFMYNVTSGVTVGKALRFPAQHGIRNGHQYCWLYEQRSSDVHRSKPRK